MSFKTATKAKAKLRAALFGPAGAGKTFTALSMASGMGEKIALIDSERGSASKYADKFLFDVVELDRKTIDEYVENIRLAAVGGYEVLVVDSLSHAWLELLEEVEKIAQAKFRGNTWSAWSEGTPKQRKLIDAIVSYPGHVIATMRSKTEWQTSQGNDGKSRPVRVGLAPEQGKGIEYEFDLLLELSTEHIANVIKDRTGKFQDTLIHKPDRDFGVELKNWLMDGVDPPAFDLRLNLSIKEILALFSEFTRPDEVKESDWIFKPDELADLRAHIVKQKDDKAKLLELLDKTKVVMSDRKEGLSESFEVYSSDQWGKIQVLKTAPTEDSAKAEASRLTTSAAMSNDGTPPFRYSYRKAKK